MSTDHVAEIKARLDILTLARQYVREVKQAGKNWKALCPFHSEKTPSFVISPDKGIAYCFGCHKGGDIFKFVQDYENCSFAEALQILADRTGVEITRVSKQEIKKIKDAKAKALVLHEEACAFFEDRLWSSRDGKKVLQYLKGRGVDESTIKEFRLGYAPEGYEDTYPAFLKSGFSRDDLVKAGLVIAKDTAAAQVYDRFRQRLMFPIQDAEGRIIAFGGRALAADVDAKYVNSPETPLYHKGRTVYNLGRARAHVRQRDSVIVVEGYMDVLMSHQAGARHVVASSGTAFTEDQIKQLVRLTKNIYFAFDADSAGLSALRRAISVAQDYDMNIRAISIPSGKDPADAVKEDSQLWLDAIGTALPYMDFCFKRVLDAYDSKTPDGVRDILAEVMPVLTRLKSRIEFDRYVGRLADILGVKANSVYDELNRLRRSDVISAQRNDYDGDNQLSDRESRLTTRDYLFGLLVTAEPAFDYFDGHYADLGLVEISIYKTIKGYYNVPRVDRSESLFDRLPEDSRHRAHISALWVEEKTRTFSDDLFRREVQRTVSTILKENFDKKKRDLFHTLKEARRDGDIKREKSLLTEYNSLLYGKESAQVHLSSDG